MSIDRIRKCSGDTFTPTKRDHGVPILTGKNGEPLRLFTQSGKPVTDWLGRPLFNICGKSLVVYNAEKKQYEDIKGNDLTDALGKKSRSYGFNPENCPIRDPRSKPLMDGFQEPLLIYDEKGDPLTNDSGQPLADRDGQLLLLLDFRGYAICDSEGKKIVNKFGESITDLRKLPLQNESGVPLRIYDRYRKPLTSANGCPLLDIKGDTLIINDESGNPFKTSYGSALYDAEGITSPMENFDLTKTPELRYEHLSVQIKETQISKIIFDMMGCPLTDYDGVPLSDSKGNSLVKVDEVSGTICDYLGNRINIILKSEYDECKFRAIRNSLGVPARLFNRAGIPLTNQRGEPLTNSCGIMLLHYNLEGYPSSDWEGNLIYDEYGVPLGSLNFNPFGSVDNLREVKPLVSKDEEPLVLFNKWGLPVTDTRGIPLFDAQRRPLIKFKNLSVEKKQCPVEAGTRSTLYEACGLPLIESNDKPIFGPRGHPARLFDSHGNPLTDRYGYILKVLNGEYLIKIDRFGRIVSDSKGRKIYDASMNPKCLYLEFNCHTLPLHETRKGNSSLRYEKQLYNAKGFPLTDSNGTVLVNTIGEPILEQNTADNDKKVMFDLEGTLIYSNRIKEIKVKHALYNKDGRPLTDNKGNILKSRCGKLLVKLDNSGIPISDAYLGELFDINGRKLNPQSPLIKENRGDIYKNIQMFNCQLYSSDDLPLLDEMGYMLYTFNGSPLIETNTDGKPVCDFKGNPIFDENGIPVTKKLTSWVDQNHKPLRLFNHNKLPLTDCNGEELRDIDGNSLIQLDELGRPAMDRWSNSVYDALGTPISDIKFDGSTPVRSAYLFEILDEETSKPVRLFDNRGTPLTDELGHILLNSDGRPLVLMTDWMSILDYTGNRPFDERKLPLGCTGKSPLLSMNGKPLRLFDLEKLPLTNEEGLPLAFANEVPLIVFDRYGRPIRGPGGGKLFDRRGRAAGVRDFDPEEQPPPLPPPLEPPLTRLAPPYMLFDYRGRPLTDNGRFLVNADGRVVITMNPDRDHVYNEYAELVSFKMDI